MENQEHPGKASLEKIRKSTGTTHEGYLAIQFLADRLEALERLVADRNRAFRPPTPEEVTAYAKSINFELDGATFCDYYEARNWCIGKTKMKSWPAAVRTWKSRRANERPAVTGRVPDNMRGDL